MEQNSEMKNIERMSGDIVASEPTPAEHDGRSTCGGGACELHTVDVREDSVAKESSHRIGSTPTDASELRNEATEEPTVAYCDGEPSCQSSDDTDKSETDPIAEENISEGDGDSLDDTNDAHADNNDIEHGGGEDEDSMVIDINGGNERELLCLGGATVGRIAIGADGVQRYYPGAGSHSGDTVIDKTQHASVRYAANSAAGQGVGVTLGQYAAVRTGVNSPFSDVHGYDIFGDAEHRELGAREAAAYPQDALNDGVTETPRENDGQSDYTDHGSTEDGEPFANGANGALNIESDERERVSPYSFADDDVHSAYRARLEELDRISGSWLSDIAAAGTADRGYGEMTLELDGDHGVDGAVAERDHKRQMRTDITALRLRLELDVARLERDCATVEYSFLHRLDDRREQRIHKKNLKRLRAARVKAHRAVRLEKKDNKRYYTFLHMDPRSKKMSRMADEETVELLRRRLGELLMKRDEYNQRLIEAYSAQRGRGRRGGKKHSYGRIYEVECRARKKAFKKQKGLARRVARSHVDKDDERMIFSLMDERIELFGRRATATYLLSKEKVKGAARREAQNDKAETERALKKNKKAIARIEKRSIVGARDKSHRRRGMLIGWSAFAVAAAVGFFIWVFHGQIADAAVGTMYWLADLLGWDFSGLN